MIVFRVDGGLDIGIAHILRCLNISKQLSNKEKIIFLIEYYDDSTLHLLSDYNVVFLKIFKCFIEEYKPEKVVFDISHKYTLSKLEALNQDIKLLSNSNIKTFMFDGITKKDAVHCNITTDINYIIVPYPHVNPDDYKITKNNIFLTGLEYFVFEKCKKNKIKQNKILISFGGSDIEQLTYQVIYLLKDINIAKCVVIGNSFDQSYKDKLISFCSKDILVEIIEQVCPTNMCEIIQESSLLITSTGLTKYEAFLLKTPSLVVAYNGYMRNFHQKLRGMGIYYIGYLKENHDFAILVKTIIHTKHIYKIQETNRIYNLLK